MRGLRDWICAACGHRVSWWRMFCDSCGGDTAEEENKKEAE